MRTLHKCTCGRWVLGYCNICQTEGPKPVEDGKPYQMAKEKEFPKINFQPVTYEDIQVAAESKYRLNMPEPSWLSNRAEVLGEQPRMPDESKEAFQARLVAKMPKSQRHEELRERVREKLATLAPATPKPACTKCHQSFGRYRKQVLGMCGDCWGTERAVPLDQRVAAARDQRQAEIEASPVPHPWPTPMATQGWEE
jgi:hypothetical protein